MTLAEHAKRLEADAFDIAEALWWFAVHHHGGQWSDLYRLSCTLGFNPGPLARGPQTFASRSIYRSLRRTWKLHERRAERIAVSAERLTKTGA